MSNSQIPIYILNLKSQPERKLFMQRQLDAFGLSYEFFDTEEIDKYAIKDDQYLKQLCDNLNVDYDAVQRKRKAFNDHLKDGTGIVCASLAHIKLYNYIQTRHEVACILEDDVVLLPSFPEVIEKAVSPTVVNDWDVLQLVSQPTIWNFWAMLNPWVYLYSNKRKVDRIILSEYGFNNTKYFKQTKYMLGILNDYAEKASYLWKDIDYDIGALVHRTCIKLGAPGDKDDFKHMTDFHLYAAPTALSYLTMAYMVKSTVLETYKTATFDFNTTFGIDDMPYRLLEIYNIKSKVLTPTCGHTKEVYVSFSKRLYS